MNPTAEQLAIIDAAATTNDNLVINALAGTGKTATLLELLPKLRGDSLLLAFNRSIADELRQRAGKKFDFIQLSTIAISTVHSHGLKAFSRAGHRAKTLDGKLNFMLKDQLTAAGYDSRDDIYRNLGKVTRLVGNAKSAGFGLHSLHENFPAINDLDAWADLAEHYNVEDDLAGETTIEEVCELAQQLLLNSNRRTNSIDFDDMIYLPLLLNLPLPQYENVLIDEAQDINATRRELAFRSVKPGGRIIAVGDPNQAIYGFTGADVASLDNIISRASARVLPLTICWRCDADIIRCAQAQVPTIQARPEAPDGQVSTVDFERDKFLDLPVAGDAILCRVNKPNVAVCLGLLRRGVRAKIEGRDLGKRLESHATKANPLYASTPLEETLDRLEQYREQEIAKLVSRNKAESTIASLEDELDATELILERALEDCNARKVKANWGDFTSLLASLFGDDVKGCVVLSSIHKAKGREWPRVFILGYKDWMPHKMAKMEWEQGQEQNLIYVAKTRAQHTLVLVNGAQSAIDRGLHREAPVAKSTEPQPMQTSPEKSADKISPEVLSSRLTMPTLDQLKEFKR